MSEAQVFAQVVLFAAGALPLAISAVEQARMPYWITTTCFLLCAPGAFSLLALAILG